MNNFIEVNAKQVEFLSTEFPDVNFKLFQSYINHSAYFSVFYCTERVFSDSQGTSAAKTGDC